MAAAHDDFFNGKSSEFDLVQQDDDFLLDSVEQPEALPVQAVQQAEQRQREKLNNGIDFSAADSPGDREKRDERQLGRSDPFDPFSTEETSFPSDVFGAAPPRAASAREASELGQPQVSASGSSNATSADALVDTVVIVRRWRESMTQKNANPKPSTLACGCILRAQASAAAAKEQQECGSGWARVYWLVNHRSNSGATATKEKDRPELSRMRRMLAELAAEASHS
ncbi:hypothetical protein cyc_04496 [Cyclospora cayetanensis]|uniref:Clathrin light chain n=1 Tax=Cyclospora cayetanensis TaxID=88456 RepID=A0A1D3D2P9_9EIME|nr:hypothetical protein cyc_04496 [Cyclospora cayetanensis]